MSPRSKAVRLIDVAEHAGVSRAAAGHVLLGTGAGAIRVSQGTAERIRHSAEQLDYHPNRAAQQLRGASTQTLGILMDTVNAPVMNDRLAAIEKEASTRGYRLLIGQLHQDTQALRAYLGDFDSRGVDAILCLFDVTSDRADRLVPVLGGRERVVLHGKPITPDGYCIQVDTAQAVKKLAAYLVRQGYRRIGLQLSGATDELMAVRRQAYLTAMQAHGLQPDEARIWTNPAEAVAPGAETVGAAIRRLVDDARADAIIASNDLWAAALIQGLKARRYRVPTDVAVTGYDNLQLGTIIDPALTTIDQQHDRYATAAVDRLIALASGKESIPARQRTLVIPPRLVVRCSA